MPVESLEPVTIPAAAEKVYDQWVVDSLLVATDRVTGRQSVAVRYALCREIGAGVFEYSPGGETREAADPDIYALAGEFPVVGEAISKLAEAAYMLARVRGIL